MGNDDGSYGSGDPYWCHNFYRCKTFSTKDSAKQWFETAKHYLFDSHCQEYNFNMDTLGVRKICFHTIEQLLK